MTSDLAEETPSPFHSGFAALVGKPNSGKSTLVNRLLGQPVAGVSARPQTTRKRQLAILTSHDYQIIFMDTPGLHEPKDKLSQFINHEAEAALRDAEVIIFLADSSSQPDENDQRLAELISRPEVKAPVLLAMNKQDMPSAARLKETWTAFAQKLNARKVLPVSALTGAGVDQLVAATAALLPEGPQYYPEDQITDVYERDIAAEIIRAAAMTLTEDEIPYSLATRVDEYSTRENGLIYIKAVLFVEREGQKAILIGKNGEKIKQIGSLAREEIEKMSGERIYLDLTVKVRKDWKNDPAFLRELGLAGRE